jgi:diaminopimelate decarboxylase
MSGQPPVGQGVVASFALPTRSSAEQRTGRPHAAAGSSPLVPARVRELVLELARSPESSFPAYVSDLTGLRAHVRAVRAALPDPVEVFYAAKANPERPVLEALTPMVDGFEVASGGELHHVRDVLPDARLAFGGPGKTERELELALKLGVERIHVESAHELRVLAAAADRLGMDAGVLLRVNLPLNMDRMALAMGGRPSPFGLDPDALGGCTGLLGGAPRLRLRGVHAHLASGLDAGALVSVAEQVVGWAHSWACSHRLPLEEVNVGGGMGVDYGAPQHRFDWQAYGRGLARLAATYPDVRLRIEPGRSLAVYSGYYVTQVLDVKHSLGTAFAVVQGGTHHLRTPVTKGHDQPFEVVRVEHWDRPWERPGVTGEPVTVVGQLCTPKDVLARAVPVEQLRAGDIVVFALAGAYAWNISHHDFLMHPAPAFHYLR